MKTKQETNINNHYDYDLADNFNQLAGGNKEKCEKIIENVSQKHVEHSTHLDGEVMGDIKHVNKIINIGSKKSITVFDASCISILTNIPLFV